MITPRSALKFDLFADTCRKGKLDGEPLTTPRFSEAKA
jgi:hypothetical protein